MRTPLFTYLLAAVALSVTLTASAQTPPAETATRPAAIDPANIHRAFRVSGDEVRERVREGKAFAEKKQTEKEVLAKYTRPTRITRGSAGMLPGEARCFGLNGNMLTFESYRAALQKKEPEIPDDLREGGFTKTLLFRFFLLSAAKKDSDENARLPTEDNLRETTVVRVILADDQGNSTEAVRLVRADSEEAGPAPTSATPVGPSYRVLFAEPRTQGRPFYTRHYQAVFPLFDTDGVPLIKPDVKKITLRIITSVGEQTAAFTL